MATVAICTSYQPSDTGSAAVRLADLLTSWGMTVFLCSTGQRRSYVSPRWDNKLCPSPYHMLAWARDLEIWLTPAADHVRDALIPYVVVHNHNFQRSVSMPFYDAARAIICPDILVHATLSDLKFAGRCRYVPWDSGLPAHSPDTATARLLLPMHYHYWRVVHPCYLKTLGRHLLSQVRKATLTVTLPQKPPPHLWKLAKQLLRSYPRQVSLRRVANTEQEWAAFSASDLVIWPAECDAFGAVPQLAIAAGAAICTWDDEEHVNLVGKSRCDMLAHTEWPLSAASHTSMLRKVRELLRDLDGLAYLRTGMQTQQLTRRTQFVRAWSDLLSDLI